MHFSYRWQATLVVGLALLMAILDATIVSVVLPQIATAFHTSYQTITWIGTGYFLANAAVIPIVGYISDRVGAKTIFLIALGIFTLGSALCAFAPNPQALIAFRVLQGIGGGAFLPVAMAMIFSWNAIFMINLPIGVVAFFLSLFVLRGRAADQEANGTNEPGGKGFDLLGLLLSMGGFTAFVYGINRAGTDGWGASTVIAFLVAGGVLLAAFVIVELLVKDPVMDVRLFRNYTFSMANFLIWVTTAVLFGSIFLLPYFFESVEGLSAMTTGEILIAQGLAMAVGLAVSGRLYNPVWPPLLSVIGAAIVAVSMIGFTRLSVTSTGADVQIWLILRGLGLGLVAQPLQPLAVSVVSNKQMAKATSLMSSTKTVFGAVGVAVLTTYLTQRTTTHVTDALANCAQVAHQAGVHSLVFQACVSQHALTMGMNDTFLFSLIGCAICAVLAIFVGRDPALAAAKAAKQRGETVEEQAPVSLVGD